MKVYHPRTGVPYVGEPVDCRELKQQAGYLDAPPTITPETVGVDAETLAREQEEARLKAEAQAKADAEKAERDAKAADAPPTDKPPKSAKIGK